jgi:hypothetical protein
LIEEFTIAGTLYDMAGGREGTGRGVRVMHLKWVLFGFDSMADRRDVYGDVGRVEWVYRT